VIKCWLLQYTCSPCTDSVLLGMVSLRTVALHVMADLDVELIMIPTLSLWLGLLRICRVRLTPTAFPETIDLRHDRI